MGVILSIAYLQPKDMRLISSLFISQNVKLVLSDSRARSSCLHMADKLTGARNRTWNFPFLCSPLWHLNCTARSSHTSLRQVIDGEVITWDTVMLPHTAHKPPHIMFLCLCYYQKQASPPDLWQVLSHRRQISTCREVQLCSCDSKAQPQLCGAARRPKYQSFSTPVIHPVCYFARDSQDVWHCMQQ